MSRVAVIPLAVGAAVATAVVIAFGASYLKGCGSDAPKASGPTGPSTGAIVGAAGMNAKGTTELEAAGCSNAVVVDMSRLMKGGSVREGEPRYMVTCDVPTAAAAPPCEKLAGTYFLAIGGQSDANVCVRVIASGTPKPVCSRLFAPSGADLGPFPRP